MTVDPAKLRVRLYPDKMLRQKAEPIDLTPNVLEVAERMVELMYESEGIGLAAPQVGLAWRMFVADVPPCEEDQAESDLPTTTKGPVVYINPELSEPARNIEPFEEGCLSLPDIRGDVIRPTEISITAIDHEGNSKTHRAAGLLARCWQHEFDHLDGVLIIDRMTQASRAMVESQIRLLERRSSTR
jgi:peptide deformylase